MPQGNAQKAAMKREKNAAKAAAAAGGKSQLETNQKALSIVCQQCKQGFLMTSRIGDLKAHYESKHSSGKNKITFEQCFPDHAGQ